MKILVWQWSRLGAPPYIAALLAEGLRAQPGVSVVLSLSRQAEILRGAAPPACGMPVDTYTNMPGFLLKFITAPPRIWHLARQIRRYGPALAVCAFPGPLDLLMAAALRASGVKFVVIVHDADAHPGDGFPLLMWLQRQLCRSADAVAALSAHVGDRLRAQGLAGNDRRPLIRLSHPPLAYDLPPPRTPDGVFHLLFFGRLLPYKGIDLLTEALTLLGPREGLRVRVVGSGPDSAALRALDGLPWVSVENRWVPEEEVGALLGWSDAIVLPYREASQSGVAAAALAAGRAVVSTNVGGLAEQLSGVQGAMLCEATPDSLADALARLLTAPPAAVACKDPKAAWRDMAKALLRQAEPLLRNCGRGVASGRAATQ